MKILIVSSYLPFPLFSGGHIRLYNLIKNLSKSHNITLVCEKRENQSESDVKELLKICDRVLTTTRKKQWSVGNVLKTGFSPDPFLIVGHKNKEMRMAIEKLLSEEKFDLIHVETFYVMQNIPSTSIPIVLSEHNIEYQVYEKFVKRSSLMLRPLLYLDILKLKKAEQSYWKKAAKLVAVSEDESKQMNRDALVIPNGVDINKFSMKKINKNKTQKKVLFIGDFRWIQNRDSIVYVIKNIWPSLQAKNPSLTLWVVGRNIPDSIKKLSDKSIFFDENAPEKTEEIFQEADLLLAPIRVGGGTNFKILESMACGTPVVTTELGNEGIGAKNGEEIIICEKPEDFVRKSLQILSDEYSYEKLSRNGRKFIEQNFDWRKIAERLNEVYKSAVSN